MDGKEAGSQGRTEEIIRTAREYEKSVVLTALFFIDIHRNRLESDGVKNLITSLPGRDRPSADVTDIFIAAAKRYRTGFEIRC